MRNFKDFGIKPALTSFTGEKIHIEKVLNIPIRITDFKIEDSTLKAGTKRLTLQIEFESVQRIIFTGSKCLQEMIGRVPKENFPFTTTIIRESKRLEFT